MRNAECGIGNAEECGMLIRMHAHCSTAKKNSSANPPGENFPSTSKITKKKKKIVRSSCRSTEFLGVSPRWSAPLDNQSLLPGFFNKNIIFKFCGRLVGLHDKKKIVN